MITCSKSDRSSCAWSRSVTYECTAIVETMIRAERIINLVAMAIDHKFRYKSIDLEEIAELGIRGLYNSFSDFFKSCKRLRLR